MQTQTDNQLHLTCIKTLLAAYSQFDERIKYNEKLIKRTIDASFSSFMNVETVVDRILDRIIRKEKLISLKNKIENLINSLPCNYGQIIRMHFIEKLTTPQIAEKKELTTRTVFRQINDGLDHCVRKMKNFGLDIMQFTELLSKFKWIENVYISQTCQ